MGCFKSIIKTPDDFWSRLPMRQKTARDLAHVFLSDDDFSKLSLIKKNKYWNNLCHPSCKEGSTKLFEEVFRKCNGRAAYFFAVTSLLGEFKSGDEINSHFEIIDMRIPTLESVRTENGGTITQVKMKHLEVFRIYIELVCSMFYDHVSSVAEDKNAFEADSKYFTKEAIDTYVKRVSEIYDQDKNKFWQENWKIIYDENNIRAEVKKLSQSYG
jgi:hypothetical protein